MIDKPRVSLRLASLLLLLLTSAALYADQTTVWPENILLTNDNGIDDEKLIRLAQALSASYQTHIIAPQDDKSGTTHFLTINKRTQIDVKKHDIDNVHSAHSLDGYPADCVVFGLFGLFKDDPPDLVISGINGGPNTGSDWIFSGTIGAARMAAFFGIPSIAISGLDDDDEDMVAAVNRYVVQLVGSELVKNMQQGEYLTMSIPRKKPEEIRGIKLTQRMKNHTVNNDRLSGPLVYREQQDSHQEVGIRFSKSSGIIEIGQSWMSRLLGDKPSEHQQWHIEFSEQATQLPAETDVDWFEKGYIVLVPMQADENNLTASHSNLAFPDWQP